jgi:hypothetical protein
MIKSAPKIFMSSDTEQRQLGGSFTLFYFFVYSSILKKQIKIPSETSINIQRTKGRYISDDRAFRNHSSDSLKILYVHLIEFYGYSDRPCGLVVRVLGYRCRSPGSIPGATTFPEK